MQAVVRETRAHQGRHVDACEVGTAFGPPPSAERVALLPRPEEWHATVRAELANAVGADPTAAAYLAATSRLFVRVAERTAP